MDGKPTRGPGPGLNPGGLSRARLGRFALLLASAALLALGANLIFRSARTSTYRLNMLADLGPSRQRLAERIRVEARNRGLEITLSKTAYGAVDELKLVNGKNSIDVALVPGGVGKGQFPDIRQVTSLTVEPLHVLVKPALHAEASKSLRALAGSRVNLGAPTMAVHLIARDVLGFVGLVPQGDASRPGQAALPIEPAGEYRVETLLPQELRDRVAALRGLPPAERQRQIDALPDAVFVLAPVPSVVVRDLVHGAGYRLVALPFTEAYSLDHFDDEPTSAAQGEAAPMRVDRGSMMSVTIPPYAYGTDPPVPETPCVTIGTRLLLIGYAPTNRDAVAKLLEVIFETPVRNVAQPPKLTEQIPLFQFHTGTDLYLRNQQPFLTPEFMTQLSKVLGGVGAFGSGIVGFYGFLKLRQLRRFESYYQEIRRIELIARGQEDDPNAPPATAPAERFAYLERRLNDLKCEALRDFAEGGMKGEGLMSGIAALVNDTRDSLARVAASRIGHP